MYLKHVSQQLMYIAFPLMISSLSGMLMLFCNRSMLAHYSLEMHNASVEAVNLGWAINAGWTSLAGIIQVFVSQNFGAKNYQLIGRFTWQMIWLSFLSIFIFYPLAKWSPYYFFGYQESHEMQRIYLYWMLLFSPFTILYTTLSCFLVGQKKVKLLIYIDVFGNILNCLLCYFFVFGLSNYLKPLGIKGVILATNVSVSFQIAILLYIYFHPNNLKKFGTHWQLNFKLIYQCIRVGFPNALFGLLEFAGWSAFYIMMASLGDKHLTIVAIVQTIMLLVSFLGEGLAKSVSVLCGYSIGKGDIKSVYFYVHTGIIFMTIFAISLCLVLWFTKDLIGNWFLSTLSQEEQNLLYPALGFGLINVVIYKYFEGIRLIFSGALIAAADTFVLFIIGAFAMWFIMIIPIYHFVFLSKASVEMALIICSVSIFFAMSLCAWRFYLKKWQVNSSVFLNSKI